MSTSARPPVRQDNRAASSYPAPQHRREAADERMCSREYLARRATGASRGPVSRRSTTRADERRRSRPRRSTERHAARARRCCEARGLTVRFGKVTALDGLELTAPPGQVLAILGPNGAGKTTFVRTVATLVRPTSGELLVRGRDVVRDAGWRPSGHRARWSVRRGRADDDRPREPRDDGAALRPRPGDGAGRRAAAGDRPAQPRRGRRPPQRHATRAASAVGWTSVPAWSAARGCCCLTSRRPDWTRSAGARSGMPFAASPPAAPTSC